MPTPTPPAKAVAANLPPSTARRPRPRPSAAPHPSPPLSPMLRRSRRLTARLPRIHRAPPSLSWFSLCPVCGATTVECRRGMSMCAACGHRHLATCVCSCDMMIIEVTHALLAPWAGVTDRVLSTRGAPRRRRRVSREIERPDARSRAQRRSSPRGPMLPLVAWLERQLTRGIWATVDHPNPKNSRRERASPQRGARPENDRCDLRLRELSGDQLDFT